MAKVNPFIKKSTPSVSETVETAKLAKAVLRTVFKFKKNDNGL